MGEAQASCEPSTRAAVTPDQERWAEALAIERIYREGARFHIAERIGALALSGDAAGIGRWKAVARRLEELEQGHKA